VVEKNLKLPLFPDCPAIVLQDSEPSVEVDGCDVVMGAAPGVDKVAIASLSSFAVVVAGETGGPARPYLPEARPVLWGTWNKK
jgi:hypothetical protein